MMKMSDLIARRRSIRTYKNERLPEETISQLRQLLQDAPKKGPFGNEIRYELILLSLEEIEQLQHLIHYGFIKGAPAFVAGIMAPKERFLEDFGYLMEDLILRTVALNLDTCWLGGSLDKHSFSKKLGVRDKEALPAIFSVGKRSEKQRAFDQVIRSVLRGDRRKPWEALFFKGNLSSPLRKEESGAYRLPLDMVRLAPSASNKQPWRVILDEKNECFHFYLARNTIYGKTLQLRGLSDLQTLDMGIAMTHFELAAREIGLIGAWRILETAAEAGAVDWAYSVSWVKQHG